MAEREACKRLGQVLQGVAPAAVVDTVVVMAVVVLGDSAWQVRRRHVVPQEREGAVPQRTVAAMDKIEDKTDGISIESVFPSQSTSTSQRHTHSIIHS